MARQTVGWRLPAICNMIDINNVFLSVFHPVKLGDYIRVLHKDYQYEGEVTEMNYFFVHIKTPKDEVITIPNSHFFDRSFSVLDTKKETKN